MARIRTIKPSFWTSEGMATVSADAALLALGLLNYADDEGFFNANPLLIKATIFPIRQTKDIAKVLLPELLSIGYLAFYSHASKIFGEVVNFTDHQKINKPTKSLISGLELVTYDYVNATVGLPVGKEGKGRERKGKEMRVSIQELSVSHIESWLKEKRKAGVYVNHDENSVIEGFKDYCASKGKEYDDNVAALRNAFAWERFAPKNGQSKPVSNNEALSKAKAMIAGGSNDPHLLAFVKEHENA